MGRGPGAGQERQVAQLADAAVRVLERGGLPALTFRNVASEAGVSPGRVQHYVRNSQGLATVTFRRVQELVNDRVRSALEDRKASSPREIVTSTLQALVPVSEEQRSKLRVAYLVEQHALTNPDLGEELRAGRAALIDFLAGQLSSIDDDADGARRLAIRLLATADGLASLALTGAVGADEAQELLADSVEQAFSPAPMS